jgi:hypothetical protein
MGTPEQDLARYEQEQSKAQEEDLAVERRIEDLWEIKAFELDDLIQGAAIDVDRSQEERRVLMNLHLDLDSIVKQAGELAV